MRSAGASSVRVTCGTQGQWSGRNIGPATTAWRNLASRSRSGPPTARYTTGLAGMKVVTGPSSTAIGPLWSLAALLEHLEGSAKVLGAHVDGWDQRHVRAGRPRGRCRRAPAAGRRPRATREGRAAALPRGGAWGSSC